MSQSSPSVVDIKRQFPPTRGWQGLHILKASQSPKFPVPDIPAVVGFSPVISPIGNLLTPLVSLHDAAFVFPAQLLPDPC